MGGEGKNESLGNENNKHVRVNEKKLDAKEAAGI